ncbi:MAG: 50S ribosomal protein L10 [Syntrophomonadaceae bacterium]|nr:50S ribosomal protein L10 [Syntrophomonadaceae bacterium]
MPNLEKKQKTVEEIKARLANSSVVIFTDYRGLSVAEMTELRNRLRETGVEFKVVKNTLTGFALRDAGLEEVLPYLEGPNAVVFGHQDPVEPAKVITDFIKEKKKLEIKVGVLEHKLLNAKEVEALAALPPKPVLVAQVLGGLQAPIRGLVYVLNANLSGLARVLNAIKEKKEAS